MENWNTMARSIQTPLEFTPNFRYCAILHVCLMDSVWNWQSTYSDTRNNYEYLCHANLISHNYILLLLKTKLPGRFAPIFNFKLFLCYRFFLMDLEKSVFFSLNPIPAGVLENQDMLGGGSIWPPPLNPMFDV